MKSLSWKYLIVLAATLIACSWSGCSKTIDIPLGWTGTIFKLTEHPETFHGPVSKFTEARGQLTINDDTRQGFWIGAGETLSFNLVFPAGVNLKFALGATKSNGRIEVSSVIGTSTISLRAVDAVSGNWVDHIVSVTKDRSTKGSLQFEFTGEESDKIFLAHPYLVIPGNKNPRRVIWISIDTLRADHLGCYGYGRDTSPNIDDVAKESLLFERCISVSPWTLPSYASMFTGRYPSITGATTDVWQLPDDETTLAEIISSGDFATFCISNIIWLNEGTALNQGFDSLKWFVHDYADKSFDLAKEWLDKNPDEDCFLLIHIVDPHVPYKPKPKFRDTFNPGYEGRYKYDFPNYSPVWSGEVELTEFEKHHLEALYDETILGVDADIGNFIGYLKESKIYDDSLLIINSDHGEEFWEHGGFEHGHQLYDEVLNVPMIIRGPGIPKGKRVGGMCSNMDIFPTILDWLKMEVPEAINAVSLLDLEQGLVETESRLLLSEQLYHGTEQKGVSTDRYRYILHTIDKSEELYDVYDDPRMLADVAPDRRSASRNFRYFATEYLLNEGAGWHVRCFRHPDDASGEIYTGTITAPSGFASVDSTRLSDDDRLEVSGESIFFSIQLENWDNKAFDFRTNDENDIVSFDLIADAPEGGDSLIFVGPEKTPWQPSFKLSILDPVFGLGQPLFGPIELDIQSGIFIWGLSETLREKSSPEIDARTLEELKSLGYLQ